ncbi:Ribonuclease 4, partial [Bos mutus]
KQINTFIHEDLATIADFCTSPAVPCTSSGSLLSCHNSSHDVSVTDCFAKAGTRPPYCHYQKKDSIRPICVGCKNGAPVHLDS